jgi:serine/threonine-protein kinase
MADLNSSPTNEKPNLDALFPELKKSDTALPAPRFMAPAAAAATLLKGTPPSSRAIPPPPSLRGKAAPPPSLRGQPAAPPSRRLSAPPPPSARAALPVQAEEVDAEELLATSPEASAAPLEPIRPVDDDYVDEGPTIALPSPLMGAPVTSRPAPHAPRPSSALPPPSLRTAPPNGATRLPPLPSAPLSSRPSVPGATKLPPLPSAPVTQRPSAPSASALPPVPAPPSSLLNLTPPSAPKAPAPAMPPVYTEEEEAVVHAPVSSRASRASAAASLAAGSGAVRAYVPPTGLPPASRPSALETMPVSRAHSLVPTAASVPPPALPQAGKRSRGGLAALGAVAALAVLGGLGFAAVKGSSALGLGSASTGTMSVTVAGPGGAKVDGLRVLVDGAVKCESAPCRLSDLSTGTHFVSAEASGFAATAARAVSVERGGDATIHFDLVANGPAKVAAEPQAKPEAKAAALNDLEPEARPTRATETRPLERTAGAAAKAEPKKADAKKDEAQKTIAGNAGEMGTLNINSIPMANVVLDGRPMGSTPLVGLKVSPGPHSVMFIHPEHGRKSSGTTVKAGGTATVAVRF